MHTTPARKKPRSVTISCHACGDIDQINDRSARRKASEGKPHICRLCRSVGDASPSESDLNWWRARYTQDEINELVAAIL